MYGACFHCDEPVMVNPSVMDRLSFAVAPLLHETLHDDADGQQFTMDDDHEAESSGEYS